MRRRAQLLLALFVCFLAGCSGLTTVHDPPSGQVTISPASASLRGGDTQQFAAQENGATGTPSFVWQVNGVTGGSAATGTIDANGLFLAPEFPPQPNAVNVTASDAADPTKSGSGSVTLMNPIPQIASVSPNPIPVGSFTLTVNGSHFANAAVVNFKTTALTTTWVSSTKLTATGTAAATDVGNVAIVVKNPDPGAISSGTLTAQVFDNSNITVAVQPATANIRAGDSQQFSATVTGSSNTGVTWSVNGTAGGSAALGTVDSNGLYAAPNTLPNPGSVTVTATSAANAGKTGSSAVTLLNPIPVLSSVSPTTIAVGAFMITVNGSKFVSGAQVLFGGQPLTTLFVSSTELSAVGTATASQTGSVAVTVTNPNPGSSSSSALNAQVVNNGPVVSAAAAARFLEQSSFGPTPELINQVQQIGFEASLRDQFSASVSTFPDPADTDTDISKLQRRFILNAVSDPDQLRQRMAFGLSEVWVVSGNDIGDPKAFLPYLRVLHSDALGNYFSVMRDITLTPAMGNYLDMVDNDKPASGQHANENYARELMQLFTLGTAKVNSDGTPVIDGSGNPVPAYTQDDVENLARAFTGWTYPTQPGQTLQVHNPEYYGGPMEPFETNHDTTAKALLGQPLAAGMSASQELDAALQIIFNHPNMPPFVARRLIMRLVTSNPSPAYVGRVAAAFSSGTFQTFGSGQRGDLQAVAAAILLDPEARRGDSSITADANDGKLREPVVMTIGLLRAFHATTDGSGITGQTSNMNQNLFFSPSVFNYFPHVSLIPGTTLNGPEFAIHTTRTSLNRVNFVNTLVFGSLSSNTRVDFNPLINLANPDQMLDWLNANLLHGTMSDSMRQSILTAVNAVSSTDARGRARAAIYLVASSSQYQVQR